MRKLHAFSFKDSFKGMYRLCSVFLLFVTASIGSAPDLEPLHVHLKPTKDIKVCEGGSVQMNCTWNVPENGSMSDKVSWHFSNITEKDECNSRTISKEISFFNNKTYNLSVLNKSSIRTDESGWYFCKVTRDIPLLINNCSNGLHVLVEANPIQYNPELNSTSGLNQTSTQDQTTTVSTICSSSAETPKSSKLFFGQWWIWVAVAVGFSVIIVSVIAKCTLSYRTKEVIYENTIPRKARCGRRDQSQIDGCNLPPSKKVETIKPLRKYDTLSQNRIRNQY
ncbi:uncharacterized protein LOC130430719 isoform X2 [Triplophysa dalaica]|uniref:uncharacterized protein LOC130430719 isoform X2 n=1 Tax=Triplophysa dalaica TaxID=1582913 RepID=UPI0024DF4668|nr:uncharacterized protein LOC130430719 isoform X2 [Triplophysa dalaica]